MSANSQDSRLKINSVSRRLNGSRMPCVFAKPPENMARLAVTPLTSYLILGRLGLLQRYETTLGTLNRTNLFGGSFFTVTG